MFGEIKKINLISMYCFALVKLMQHGTLFLISLSVSVEPCDQGSAKKSGRIVEQSELESI